MLHRNQKQTRESELTSKLEKRAATDIGHSLVSRDAEAWVTPANMELAEL